MNRSDLARFRQGQYPGGKSGSGVHQKIINLMPPHQVYIEPFLGSGAVMRRKLPAKLNIGIDLDPDIIAAWAAVPPGLLAAVAGESRGGTRSRSLAPSIPPSPDPAARSRGACPARPPAHDGKSAGSVTDSSASRSTGMRSRPGPAAQSAGNAAQSAGASGQWQFHCADGIDFLRQYPWTGCELVYCDPPYVHETRRDLRLYGRYEMSQGQHIALLDVLLSLRVPVMLSGYRSGLYSLALHGWHQTDYQCMTRRGAVTETLWCNFPAPAVLHDYRYLGSDRRKRENVRRMQARWTARIAAMRPLERQAILAALAETSTAGNCAGAEAPSVFLQPSSSASSRISG